MENLDKIHEHFKESTMALIINNNSKLLLDDLYNTIYRKSTYSKCKISSSKGLIKKISNIKNKFICIDLDLSKIQLSSCTNNERCRVDFGILKNYLIENESKIIFRSNTKIDFITMSKYWSYYMPTFSLFDLVIFIDKYDIKIVTSYTKYKIFNIDTLIRKIKLKKLKDLYKNKK